MTAISERLRGVPRAAWLILLVALVVRVAVAAEMDLLRIGPGEDSADYDRHARSIADGHGYPPSVIARSGDSAFRPPAYPYFLGAVYAVSGNHPRAARYVQAVVGTVTVALIGLLAWQLAGAAVGLASLGVAAVYPPLIAVGTSLLTEALFVPLELAALAAALAHRRSGHRYRWALAAGLLAGLACLTRPNGVLLLLPLAVALWPGRPEISLRSGRAVAVLLATAAITVVPWTIRNAVVMDGFVPVSTESGYLLAGMYNAATRGADDKGIWLPTQFVPQYTPLFGRRDIDEVELDDRLRSDAIDFIGDHPGYPFRVAFLNSARLLHLIGNDRSKDDWTTTVGLRPWLIDAERYGFYAVAALALVGLFTLAARRVPLFVWLVPVLLGTGVLVGGLIRYRAPIDPFIVILAGFGLVALLGQIGRPKSIVSETSCH